MKYLPPSTLFGGMLTPPLDKKAIQLERKKLLAELELTGGDTVEVNGASYDRNEIIRYFEELMAENTLEYHNAVSEDEDLLRFLSDQEIGTGTLFQRKAIFDDPAFIRWISPWYSEPFRRLVIACLEQSGDLTMEALMRNPLLMTISDQEKIWNEIGRLIVAEIDLLERYHLSNRRQVGQWRDAGIPTTEIAGFMEYNHIRVLSLLPESRFAELLNRYAFAMMQASITTFNRHPRKRDTAETWIVNAEVLAVNPQLKRQIVDKLDEFRNIRKKKSPVNFRWIAILIIAINVGRLLFGSTTDLDTTTIEHAPVIITNPKTHGDSMIRAILDSERTHAQQGSPLSPVGPSH